MVRLKADSVVAVYHICLISIPYGAIKRPTKKAILEIGSAFQFLMVRLKVYFETPCFLSPRISIPYGAIKRDAQLRALLDVIHFNSLWCD
mgnify:CR=1 FL=1